MNADDLIGYLVVANENLVLGVTIDAGQFILFRYQGAKFLGSQVMQVTAEQEYSISGYRQVITVESRSPNELFIIALREGAINVFALNYHNAKLP